MRYLCMFTWSAGKIQRITWKRGLAEYLCLQQKGLSLKANQRQDANSQLERGDKFDGRGKGSTTAASPFSGDFLCLDPTLFSCFTPRVTLHSVLIFALATYQESDPWVGFLTVLIILTNIAHFPGSDCVSAHMHSWEKHRETIKTSAFPQAWSCWDRACLPACKRI